MKVGFDILFEPRMNETFPAWLCGTIIARNTLSTRFRPSGLRFLAASDNANQHLIQAPFDGRRSIMTCASASTRNLFKVPVYHFYELLRLLGDRHGAVSTGGELRLPAFRVVPRHHRCHQPHRRGFLCPPPQQRRDPPATPGWVEATAEDGQVILCWTPNQDPFFYSYAVYLIRDGKPVERLSSVPLRAAMWVDTAAPPGGAFTACAP